VVLLDPWAYAVWRLLMLFVWRLLSLGSSDVELERVSQRLFSLLVGAVEEVGAVEAAGATVPPNMWFHSRLIQLSLLVLPRSRIRWA